MKRPLGQAEWQHNVVSLLPKFQHINFLLETQSYQPSELEGMTSDTQQTAGFR